MVNLGAILILYTGISGPRSQTRLSMEFAQPSATWEGRHRLQGKKWCWKYILHSSEQYTIMH